MPGYVALLRAINVGGTGKLAMSDLRALCEGAGFRAVKTYIQSGNVVFQSKLSESKVKAALEPLLLQKLGKPCSAMIRSGTELRHILAHNPFAQAPPSRVIVFFLDEAPRPDSLRGIVIPGREALKLGQREVFVHYPEGQGPSKLKLPFADQSTGRNLNTVAKLAEMVAALDG